MLKFTLFDALFFENLGTIIMWGHVPGVSRVQEIVRKKEKGEK